MMILPNAGNHTWVAHAGTTKMPSALSKIIFCTHLVIKQNGGKAQKKFCDQFKSNAFTHHASGSGIQDTNFSTCLFSLEANKSTSGFPQICTISPNTSFQYYIFSFTPTQNASGF
jgi:hypothetical protein